MVELTNSMKCVLKIIELLEKKATTRDILENTELFPEICIDCKSGTRIINAAMQLYRMGLVEREIHKGGFSWQIKK